MRKWVAEGGSPLAVADMVVKAAMAKRPKLRYSVGKQSHQVRALRRFKSEWIVDRAFRKANDFPA